MATRHELKREMCEIGKRIWQRGYVASNDGNLSIKLKPDLFLCTPTGVSKGFMHPEMMITVNGMGEKLAGNLKPSSEMKMHLEIYQHRPDVQAVVHAHPVYATAFAVAGIPLIQCVLPEIVLTMGGAPIAPYATPGTEEVPASVAPLIHKTDAILLANHGAVTVGTTLEEAYLRMESLEHFAEILSVASRLGSVNYLSEENVKALEDVRRKLGIKGAHYACELCEGGTC